MAKLRSAKCYRRVKRPYTRISRFQKKGFIKGVPGSKVVMYDMGNKSGEFKNKVSMFSKNTIQIRHNALEAARLAANRYLERKLGRSAYHFKIKIFPHHVMRHNPLATGAGADRLSSGMAHAFGKPLGRAAQVKEGQEIMFVEVDDKGLEIAKEALKRASAKLPCKTRIIISK